VRARGPPGALAGTSTVRTTKVSISTPTPTVTPISNRSYTGSTASTQNVPARIKPALVITGPVAASARSIPSLVPCAAASSRTRLIRKML
jgi:hypothetical protein